jgi:hypothetical protein
MTNQPRMLSSLPPRPLSMVEIETLEEHNRIQSIVEDDITVDDEAAGLRVSVSSCVLITPEWVTAAVYVDADKAWQQLYTARRPHVDLTEAYEAVRAFRGEETVFASAPLSPREAIHRAEVANKQLTGDPDYAEVDGFDCPLCDAIHTVSRRDEQSKTDD